VHNNEVYLQCSDRFQVFSVKNNALNILSIPTIQLDQYEKYMNISDNIYNLNNIRYSPRPPVNYSASKNESTNGETQLLIDSENEYSLYYSDNNGNKIIQFSNGMKSVS
jgi:hypothetical protein